MRRLVCARLNAALACVGSVVREPQIAYAAAKFPIFLLLPLLLCLPAPAAGLLIQGAVDRELQPLLAALRDKQQIHVAAWTFWTGNLAGKPVVISMGDVAASGGYWISMHAARIFAEPTTITGSIGVFGLHFNYQEYER